MLLVLIGVSFNWVVVSLVVARPLPPRALLSSLNEIEHCLLGTERQCSFGSDYDYHMKMCLALERWRHDQPEWSTTGAGALLPLNLQQFEVRLVKVVATWRVLNPFWL